MSCQMRPSYDCSMLSSRSPRLAKTSRPLHVACRRGLQSTETTGTLYRRTSVVCCQSLRPIFDLKENFKARRPQGFQTLLAAGKRRNMPEKHVVRHGAHFCFSTSLPWMGQTVGLVRPKHAHILGLAFFAKHQAQGLAACLIGICWKFAALLPSALCQDTGDLNFVGRYKSIGQFLCGLIRSLAVFTEAWQRRFARGTSTQVSCPGLHIFGAV